MTGRRVDTLPGIVRRREGFCPEAILRCAHVDGDVVQVWRSSNGSTVIEGPHGQGMLGMPVVTYARHEFDIEWQHRAALLCAPATVDEPR